MPRAGHEVHSMYYVQLTRQGAWAVLEPPKGCPLTTICGIRQYEIAAKMCKNEESLIFVHNAYLM